jgi:hypothetical protein
MLTHSTLSPGADCTAAATAARSDARAASPPLASLPPLRRRREDAAADELLLLLLLLLLLPLLSADALRPSCCDADAPADAAPPAPLPCHAAHPPSLSAACSSSSSSLPPSASSPSPCASPSPRRSRRLPPPPLLLLLLLLLLLPSTPRSSESPRVACSQLCRPCSARRTHSERSSSDSSSCAPTVTATPSSTPRMPTDAPLLRTARAVASGGEASHRRQGSSAMGKEREQRTGMQTSPQHCTDPSSLQPQHTLTRRQVATCCRRRRRRPRLPPLPLPPRPAAAAAAACWLARTAAAAAAKAARCCRPGLQAPASLRWQVRRPIPGSQLLLLLLLLLLLGAGWGAQARLPAAAAGAAVGCWRVFCACRCCRWAPMHSYCRAAPLLPHHTMWSTGCCCAAGQHPAAAAAAVG